MKVLLVAAACAALVAGHGGLTFPPPRNNWHNTNPGNHTPDGSLDKIHAGGPCAGGECFWFSEGCYIGCPNCTSREPKTGNRYNTPNCEKPAEPTLPLKYRTWNIKNLSARGDFTRYHPWRAPGRAPVADPCGIAGGYGNYTFGGGETPVGAKHGALGSKLPPLKDVHTKWIAGGVAEVGWMVGANHGGGYSYSVCPKGAQGITQECFQQTKHALDFVGETTTIRYIDGSRAEVEIPALTVTEGTYPPNSAWRSVPVPACNCDYGRQCVVNSPEDEPRAYWNGTAPEPSNLIEKCGTGTQFPVKFDYGYGAQHWNEPWDSRAANSWVMVDKVRVPKEEGEYVLQWRWDAEQNPQVWTHCADITVVSGSPSSAPCTDPHGCCCDPLTPCYYDPVACGASGNPSEPGYHTGCVANGQPMCRFCGFGPYTSIACPKK
eukprot:g2395.t1